MTGFWDVLVLSGVSPCPMRVSISSTAFLLKAIARICEGGMLWVWMRFRIRAVTTVVLPLPGPAMTIAGPVTWLAAFSWFLSSFI